MTTPDADGWIPHNGGPCPVAPDVFAQVKNIYGDVVGTDRAREWAWDYVTAYRVFAPVTPGPSPFVAETAARIMAGFNIGVGVPPDPLAQYAAAAVAAAQALEAALKDAAP